MTKGGRLNHFLGPRDKGKRRAENYTEKMNYREHLLHHNNDWLET